MAAARAVDTQAVRGDAYAVCHNQVQQLRHAPRQVQQPRVVHACNAALHAVTCRSLEFGCDTVISLQASTLQAGAPW